MFIERARASEWIRSITATWPILATLGFTSALSFQVGYLTFPFGLSVFHVSLEDLSKTGLLIFLGLSVFQSIFAATQIFKFFESKLLRTAIVFVAAAMLIGADLYSIILGTLQDDPISFYLKITSIFITIVAAVSFAILHLLFNNPEEQISLDLTIVLLLLTVVLCFTFGLKNFLTDLNSSKNFSTTFNDSKEFRGLVIAERSEYFLALLPLDCTYVRISKSASREVRYERAPLSSLQKRQMGACVGLDN